MIALPVQKIRTVELDGKVIKLQIVSISLSSKFSLQEPIRRGRHWQQRYMAELRGGGRVCEELKSHLALMTYVMGERWAHHSRKP
jgi:hypothetical protein